MTYLVPIASTNEIPSVELVGGKGMSLVRLATGHFNVPEGFVLTTNAYKVFADKTELSSKYSTLHEQKSLTIEDAEVISKDIESIFMKSEFPSEYGDEMMKAIDMIRSHNFDGPNLLAIRSSATTEDLSDASFAGMHDTILNVPIEIESIKKAILQCWSSLYTPRAILYRIEKGFPVIDTSIAVVVQRMIPADRAGVVFSCDPQTSSREHVSLDGVWGLGETLVSGLVSSDHWSIRKHYPIDKYTTELKIVDEHICDQQFAYYTKQNRGTEEVQLNEKGKTPCFTKEEIYTISECAVKIEEYYHKPMDIEFCWYKNQVYIVQARPITTLLDLPSDMDPFSPSYKPQYSAFMCYSYDQMMLKPFSVGGFTHGCDLVKPLDVKTRLIFNYPYVSFQYVLVNKRLTSNFAKHYAEAFEYEIGNLVDDYAKSDFFVNSHLVDSSDFYSCLYHIVPPILWDAFWYYFMPFSSSSYITKFHQMVEEPIRYYDKLLEGIDNGTHIPTLSSGETDKYNQYYLATTVVPFVLIAGLYDRQLQSILSKYNIPEVKRKKLFIGRVINLASIMTYEEKCLHNDLINCGNDDSHFLPQLQTLIDEEREEEIKKFISSMKDSPYPSHKMFYENYNSFMKIFGRRGPGEIDLANPRYEDKPSMLLSDLLNSSGNAEDERSPSSLSKESDEVAEEIFSKMSWIDAFYARRYLAACRTCYDLREHPKYLLVSLLTAKRKILLHIGEEMVEKHILDSKEDIFHLQNCEVRAYEQNKIDVSTFKSLVQQRKEELKRHQHIEPPRIIATQYQAMDFICQKTKESLSKLPPNMLKGVSAYPGVVEGRAVVMKTPRDCKLEKDDILIARATDPSWTPLFGIVKGAAIEVGGPLSHGSIVAREMAVPCVVSVTNLTKKIKTGMNIRIDSTQGTITILSDDE